MLKQVMQAYEFLDDAHINGPKVAELLKSRGLERIDVKTISGTEGSTDFIRIVIPGAEGKQSEGSAPTLGIIGRLGGIGADSNVSVWFQMQMVLSQPYPVP